MALEKLTGAVELIKALKEQEPLDSLLDQNTAELKFDDLDDMANDFAVTFDPAKLPDDKAECDEEGQKCRPGRRSDYLRRLRTFSAPSWFNMPIGASPIECARRGWKNVGIDVIECECCGLQVTAEQLRKDTGPRARLLVEGHSPFCPWRSHEVSLADPSKLSDREVAEDVAQRLSRLKASLRHYPVLVDDSPAEKTLKALAFSGWEVVENGKCADTASQLLRCAFCNRTVAVQSFNFRPVPEIGQEAEEVAEGVDAASERPSKVARRSPPLPPEKGLWCPQARLPALGVQAASPEVDVAHPFDMYSLHRFFCPMYSRAGDNAPRFSLRAWRVYEEASKPQGSGGAGVDTGVDDAEAVARAEEALRAFLLLMPAS
jgi:hypothetical protein